MNIYIDFDDCLCETARHFEGLVKDLFDKDVPNHGYPGYRRL